MEVFKPADGDDVRGQGIGGEKGGFDQSAGELEIAGGTGRFIVERALFEAERVAREGKTNTVWTKVADRIRQIFRDMGVDQIKTFGIGDFVRNKDLTRFSDTEIADRLSGFARPPIPSRGYAKLYANHILGAELGCDFDFLTA